MEYAVASRFAEGLPVELHMPSFNSGGHRLTLEIGREHSSKRRQHLPLTRILAGLGHFFYEMLLL